MSKFQQVQKEQEAEAKAWLEAHESELSDVAIQPKGYGEREGYEIICHIIEDMAEDESQQDDIWEGQVSEDTTIDTCCHMNVTTLKHWSQEQAYDETGAPVGDRFCPERFAKHDRLARKRRARFGIEFCYHGKNGMGKVRASLGNYQERQVARKKVTIASILDDLAF
jgi:hypothetical protein